MTGMKAATEETYIRMLPFSVVNYLARLLDIDKQWERLVVHIPKRLADLTKPQFEQRYSQLQVRIFDDKGKRSDGSSTRAIIEDWGTQNTKVKHLMYALMASQLFEAADYISIRVLNGQKVPRPTDEEEESINNIPPPCIGDPVKKHVEKPQDANLDQDDVKKTYEKNKYHPALHEAVYQRNISYDSGGTPSLDVEAGNIPSTSMQAYENEETLQVRAVKEPCETTDDSCTVDELDQLSSQKMAYKLLEKITNFFNEESYVKGGRVVGCGGFGQVYLGIFPNGMKVAVKCLKNVEEVEKQFDTELDSLTKFRHENIVSLLGYSIDGPNKCLVYEYLANGSLEDRLICKHGTPPLSVKLRVSIAQGAANGIYFLNKNGIVHRDIKSANILLGDNFEAKVGDFATVRAGPRGMGTAMVNTTLVIGTPAYLAPEALNFDISTKLDSYSFGVVILELLTGLPAMDHTREEKDLKSYVEECEDLITILDVKAGHWPQVVVDSLNDISQKCLAQRKKQRKNVEDILQDLNSIKSE